MNLQEEILQNKKEILENRIQRLYHKSTNLYVLSIKYKRFKPFLIDKAFESELHKLLIK